VHGDGGDGRPPPREGARVEHVHELGQRVAREEAVRARGAPEVGDRGAPRGGVRQRVQGPRRDAVEAAAHDDDAAVAAARRARGERRAEELRLGRTRAIQRRFNVSVPRARVPGKASTLRDRSKR
jgi:hypothetical protein